MQDYTLSLHPFSSALMKVHHLSFSHSFSSSHSITHSSTPLVCGAHHSIENSGKILKERFLLIYWCIIGTSKCFRNISLKIELENDWIMDSDGMKRMFFFFCWNIKPLTTIITTTNWSRKKKKNDNISLNNELNRLK